MKRTVFALLILAGTCLPTGCGSPAERQAEEYAVYRTLLGDDTERCIYGQTIELPRDLLDEFPKREAALMEDYYRVNEEPVELDTGLLGRPVVLCGRLQACRCTRVQGFSRVGFNARMDKALVLISWDGWDQDDDVYLFFQVSIEQTYLVKGEDGAWEVKESDMRAFP